MRCRRWRTGGGCRGWCGCWGGGRTEGGGGRAALLARERRDLAAELAQEGREAHRVGPPGHRGEGEHADDELLPAKRGAELDLEPHRVGCRIPGEVRRARRNHNDLPRARDALL